MNCELPTTSAIHCRGGVRPCAGRRNLCHARLPSSPEKRGPIWSLERVPAVERIRRSFQENRKSHRLRHCRGRRAWIRDAERTHGNVAGSQVQASKGPQVAPHLSDRSPCSWNIPQVRELHLGLKPPTSDCASEYTVRGRYSQQNLGDRFSSHLADSM